MKTDPYSTKEYKDAVRVVTYYEWIREDIDEHGNIQDSDFASTLKELRARYNGGTFGLVRNVGSQDEGVTNRERAYLGADGKLPEFFDGGSKVPQRFHKEAK